MQFIGVSLVIGRIHLESVIRSAAGYEAPSKIRHCGLLGKAVPIFIYVR